MHEHDAERCISPSFCPGSCLLFGRATSYRMSSSSRHERIVVPQSETCKESFAVSIIFWAAATLRDCLLDDADGLSSGPAAATGLAPNGPSSATEAQVVRARLLPSQAGQLGKLSFGIPRTDQHGLSATIKGPQSLTPLAPDKPCPPSARACQGPKRPSPDWRCGRQRMTDGTPCRMTFRRLARCGPAQSSA